MFGSTGILPGRSLSFSSMGTDEGDIDTRLAKARKESEDEKAEAFARAIESLRGRSVADLIQLKNHWQDERKRQRRLDQASIEKRHTAENYIEAIETLLKNAPRATRGEASSRIIGLPEINPENMSVTEVAQYLRISKSKLYKMTSANEIAHSKIGKLLSFKKSDLDEYIKSHRNTTTAEMALRADEYLANKRPRRQPRR